MYLHRDHLSQYCLWHRRQYDMFTSSFVNMEKSLVEANTSQGQRDELSSFLPLAGLKNLALVPQQGHMVPTP